MFIGGYPTRRKPGALTMSDFTQPFRARYFTETVATPISPRRLKLCELCHALNLETNRECFICGWRGRFDRDPLRIMASLELVEPGHAALPIHLFTNDAYATRACAGLRGRLRYLLTGVGSLLRPRRRNLTRRH